MPQFILTLKGRELKRLTIEKPQLTIGRDPDDDLHIDNIGISRSHVKIRVTAQGDVFALDNKSSNGTFINGQKITSRHKLQDGDDIQLAKYVITYSASGGGRLDINKLRENARQANAPGPKSAAAAQGTLSFSPDEIKKLVDSSPAKPKEPDLSDMDPLERLFADEKAKREQAAQAEAAAKKGSGGANNQIVVMGLAAIILLLLVILVLLLKR